MTGLTLVVDDYALASLPTLDWDLAQAGAWVMRSFKGLPNPGLLRRYPGAAVVGGFDKVSLLARLEAATTSLTAPVIAVLPQGCDPSPELRGPGVVDLIPALSKRAAERILLMARVPIVSSTRGAAARPPLRIAHLRADEALTPAPALSPLALPVPSGLVAQRPLPAPQRDGELLAIASSTGGVWVLAALLRDLGRDRAVAVAQHLEGEFVPFFAEWLQATSGWPSVVVDGAVSFAPGVVYVPAGGCDLLVEGERVVAASACSRYVPNGDRLLESAAKALGPRALGLVLSGMGSDGALGLAELARRGGRALCQDPASAVVGSMPESALRRTPSAAMATPERLAATIGAWRPPRAEVRPGS